MNGEVTDNEQLIFNRLLQCEKVTLCLKLIEYQPKMQCSSAVAELVFVPNT